MNVTNPEEYGIQILDKYYKCKDSLDNLEYYISKMSNFSKNIKARIVNER